MLLKFIKFILRVFLHLFINKKVMHWYISFGNRKFPNKVAILERKRLEKTSEHYLYEIELVDGFEIRYNEYLKEGNEDNLRVHVLNQTREPPVPLFALNHSCKALNFTS